MTRDIRGVDAGSARVSAGVIGATVF